MNTDLEAVAHARASLEALGASHVNALLSWLEEYTKEREEQLKQANHTQKIHISSLQDQLSAALEKLKLYDGGLTRAEADALHQSQKETSTECEKLLTLVKNAKDVIGASLNKIKALSNERDGALATAEVLRVQLEVAEQHEEELEEKMAALKGNSDGVSTVKGIPLKDVGNTPPRTVTTEEQSNLQVTIDRLKRKLERLTERKESADKKYYASYVRWQRFKEWWLHFKTLADVPPLVRKFNTATLDGTIRVPARILNNLKEMGREDDLIGNIIESGTSAEQLNSSKETEDCEKACTEMKEIWDNKASHTPVKNIPDSQETVLSESVKSNKSPLIVPLFTDESQIKPLPNVGKPQASTVTPIVSPPLRIKASSIRNLMSPRRAKPASPTALTGRPVRRRSILGKRKADGEEGSELQLSSDALHIQKSLKTLSTATESLRQKRMKQNAAQEETPTKKGRGRYAQNTMTSIWFDTDNSSVDLRTNESGIGINAYKINPQNNQGLDFAYDDVVRKKDERKKLEATACDCCREYYEAVGPLPPRAQGPKWRDSSPSQEPSSSRPCRHQDPEGARAAKEKEMSAHQAEISRHRQTWVSPGDPPGYWNIGFPDTQEAIEINREAEERRAAKEARMEMESRKPDGKYKRR